MTNLGISVKKDTSKTVISLSNEVISISDSIGNRSFIRSGTQLLFILNPNEGIKICHKLPQIIKPEQLLIGNIVNNIPASKINRKVILEIVIDFMEKINEVKKTEITTSNSKGVFVIPAVPIILSGN